MFYTVLENQMIGAGSFGAFYWHYTNLNDAMAKFFSVCASAAGSALAYHSATILASDGRIVRQEIFDRREPVIEE